MSIVVRIHVDDEPEILLPEEVDAEDFARRLQRPGPATVGHRSELRLAIIT
ncbi:hypothetical protein ACXPWS_00150 [Mycobacterium sp. BMJ-28]